METTASPLRGWWALAGCILALACFRLCHVHLLWADEDYHLAAAIHLLHGKIPYRDFWYDKPPLSAFYYLLIGGYSGWALRLLDAGYICCACRLIYGIARTLWSRVEGWTAALLLAFFTTFYLPSAVIPFAADALMLAPHLAAVYCALKRRAFWAGVWAGAAFLANTKAVFVAATCAVWIIPEVGMLAAGFVLPVGCAAIAVWAAGAWPGYYEQVWRWGLIYAERAPVTRPFWNGFARTLNWLGFHAAIAAGAVCGFARLARRTRWRLGIWTFFSFAGVAIGWRFAPHYYLQVLPALIVAASRGLVWAISRYRRLGAAVLGLLLLIPLIRFGPRYVSLAYENIAGREPHWIDVAMDLDSQEAAEKIRARREPGDTLFVWGYRPDVYVYTRMSPDGRFWDSQPLTGVPADRHLHADDAIYGGPAAANREELSHSRPTFVVDGLGLLNPRLAPGVYPELRPWLAHYKAVDRTQLSVIYRRME
jgi:hypothetical protein